MGWIVFEEESGYVKNYYRSESVAKGRVTKHNNEIGTDKASPWTSDRAKYRWAYCSYQDYEGVLMGMREPERRMWAFCRG